MAQWDYSTALLFQVAAWMTLQFWRLRVAVTIVLLFLKCALHSTLPPAATAAIAHAFKEYCGGPFNAAPRCNGGNCAYVQGILRRRGQGERRRCSLGGAVRLRLPPGNGGVAGWVGAVAVRRRAGGGGGPSGLGPGTDGKGSDNGGGMDRWRGQWRWCKQRQGQCHGIVSRSLARSCNDELVAGRTMVPWHCRPSHAHWRNVELTAGQFTVPHHRWQSLPCWRNDELAARRTTMPQHCRPFPCSLMQWRRRGADDGGSLLHRRQWGVDESGSALLCNGGGSEADDRASG